MRAKRVVLKGYYNLGDEYLVFEENPLHGKTYDDVEVSIDTKLYNRSYGTIVYDVVNIEGCEPIECELVNCYRTTDGTWNIGICQDWG